MAKYLRVREQHIAVFGESGSGKTVLVSSFFGPTQEGTYSNDLWDLIAEDTGQGDRLYKNYLGMRNQAKLPQQTRFNSTTYNFSLRLRGGGGSQEKNRPFDAVRLAWHDYPGEWFHESPSSEEEAERRIETFRSLLRSDVALLLVDGQRMLDYHGEEERYLKSMFTNIRQGLLRLKDELLTDGQPLVEFPRIWVLALSKADLLPDWDVHTFRDTVIEQAADDLDSLRKTLQSFVVSPEAMSIGEDFMLLSSAKFELASASADPVTIDVTQRVGVDLILPIASLLPMERRAQWEERMELPRRVMDSMADGADTLAAALIGGKLLGVDKVLERIPRVGKLLSRAALPALAAGAKLAGTELRRLNTEARDRKDHLTATLTQFKIDLEQGVTDRLLIRSLK